MFLAAACNVCTFGLGAIASTIAATIKRRRRQTPFFTRPPGGESHRDGPR
jgi:hypothetical protein